MFPFATYSLGRLRSRGAQRPLRSYSSSSRSIMNGTQPTPDSRKATRSRGYSSNTPSSTMLLSWRAWANRCSTACAEMKLVMRSRPSGAVGSRRPPTIGDRARKAVQAGEERIAAVPLAVLIGRAHVLPELFVQLHHVTIGVDDARLGHPALLRATFGAPHPSRGSTTHR